TSRAEYRLHLREDNADLRLTEIGHELGCVASERFEALRRKRDAIEREKARLSALWAGPSNADGRALASTLGITLTREATALDLLRRPELTYAKLTSVAGFGPPVDEEQVAAQIEIGAKYAGYLDRQQDEIERHRRHEETRIPDGFDYQRVRGLSSEALVKLTRSAPTTVGQAQRISGITPAAISLLLVHLKRGDKRVA
ncbi:MAG: tRNA uridine-5-carboxymethylaminomethyl(34) synthesis enzyme MnmG, partial [Dokdonella sp.]